jgi:ankyrin repeat protein
MDRFRHEPINLEGHSFRLLRLLAGFGQAQCEIIHAYLDDENIMEYEALSYAWEGLDEFYEIEVNGCVMPVTKSLSLALRNLRYPHQDRILWVDAICIDQGNDKERGHQVNQMGAIYKKAEKVLIWLGPATLETNSIFDAMYCFQKESSKYACRNWEVSDERWHGVMSSLHPSNNSNNNMNITPTITQKEGLEDLLTRPWFDRMWIIQEVANARAARVVCGAKSVLARTFALFPHLLGITPSRNCQAILDVMPGPTRNHSWWTKSHDLNTLLRKFKGSKASDPRDKIYALLGIASDQFIEGFPLPDYEKSERDVLLDTVTFLLTVAGQGSFTTLNILLDTGNSDANLENSEGQTPFLLAVENNHDEVLKMLVESDTSHLNTQNKRGQTPLLLASRRGKQKMVELILDTGVADTELKDTNGWTSLWAAAIEGHEATVKRILQAKEGHASTSIHQDTLKTERLLTRALLRINKCGYKFEDGLLQLAPLSWSPLSWAYVRHDMMLFTMFHELMDMDISQTSVNLLLDTVKTGLTPDDTWAIKLLRHAILIGDEEMINFWIPICADSGLFAKNVKNEVFEVAVERGDEVAVDFFMKWNVIDTNGKADALWEAAKRGHSSIFSRLLDSTNFNVNSLGLWDQTPLWRAVEDRNTAVVEMLIRTPGIDVNLRASLKYRSPLSLAIESGYAEIVRLLLDAPNIKVNTKNSGQEMPLLLASELGRVEMVKLLINTPGIEVNSCFHISPLEAAARQGYVEIVELLLKAPGIEVDPKGSWRRQTPLSAAAENGHAYIARLLLETKCANVNARDGDGRTPLFLAVQGGYVGVAKLLIKTDDVDIGVGNSDGVTPLMLAAKHGRADIVELLLETNRVDLTSTDSQGWTALDHAGKKSHWIKVNVVQLLEKHGAR